MNRRRAVSVAGTATAAALGGALAMAANFGLLGFARSDAPSLGQLEAASASVAPETPAPKVVTRYEDIFVPAPSPAPSAPGSLPSDRPATVQGVPDPTTAPDVELHLDDEDHHEDEDDDRFEDHHEDEDHEDEDVTEGLEDDD
jgi:hypothetical protein